MQESISPYRPLWLYRFFEFFRRLPIPAWLFVTVIILGVGIANLLVAWQAGYLPEGQIDGYLATVGLYIVIMPTIWVLSSKRAQLAIHEFYAGDPRKKVKVEKAAGEFNSLPNWLAILLLAAGLFQGIYIFNNITVRMLPLSSKVLPFLGLLSWLSTNGFLYLVFGKGIRQLVLIRRMYAEMNVDIFNRRPIYALSRYASWMAVAALIVAYGFQSIAFPEFLLTPLGFSLAIATLLLVLCVFFVPLLDINRAMVDAKEQLLFEINHDLKSLQQRVHQSVWRKELVKISDLRTAIGALKDELEIVQKIPTWPWQSDSLRNLLVPLFIPILVYVIQRFLGGMLGI